MAEAYIVRALRTAGGRRGGRLAPVHPVDLGAAVINALVEGLDFDRALVDDVIWGCVGQAGEQSTNVGRNTVLASVLPQSVPGTSLDRQCGSSQQALHFAAQAVMSGTQDIVIAGGVESMTRVPMGMPVTLPFKNGFGTCKSPGIEAKYPGPEFSQFTGAERVAAKYGFDRATLDAFALESHRKAVRAVDDNRFADEIVPITVTGAEGGDYVHDADEGVRRDATLEGIGSVRLLQEGGVLSAASASQICDGASGVLVVNERGLKALGVAPLARIHTLAVIGGDPVIMLDAPAPATELALKKAGMTINDIDLFEVNEAFASIPLAWLQRTGADSERMNVNGGAIALGHPLGGTGTKLMATLVHALGARGKRFGLQTMCEGGGMANATIIERL